MGCENAGGGGLYQGVARQPGKWGLLIGAPPNHIALLVEQGQNVIRKISHLGLSPQLVKCYVAESLYKDFQFNYRVSAQNVPIH